jgi:hypothetical protein
MTQDLPYKVPAAVAQLGEPERVFMPRKGCAPINLTLGLTLGIGAVLFCIGAGAMYFATKQPGTDETTKQMLLAMSVVVFLIGLAILAGALFLATGGADNKLVFLIFPDQIVELSSKAHRIIPWNKLGTIPDDASFGSIGQLKYFRFSTGTKQNLYFDHSTPNHDELAELIRNRIAGKRFSSSLPSQSRSVQTQQQVPGSGIQAQKTASARTVSATTPEGIEQSKSQQTMNELMLDPALQKTVGNLVTALVEAAPSHYAMLHLIAEVRPSSSGAVSVLFTHGSPVLLNEYSTNVPDSIANASYGVIEAFRQRHGEKFPGVELVLRKTADNKWDLDMRSLDDQSGAQWSNLPRYPLRIVGHGLSLAPPPDTVFRWQFNTNPPGIIASIQGDANTVKRAQIILNGQEPQIALSDGVKSAAEVIQICEGPKSDVWTIETPKFSIRWPAGFDLRFPLASKTSFDLLGVENGSMIFIQGPLPNEELADGMGAPGQTEVATGKTPSGYSWTEYAYEAEGKSWRQRHYTRQASSRFSFVISSQAPADKAESTFLAANEVTDSLAKPFI